MFRPAPFLLGLVLPLLATPGFANNHAIGDRFEDPLSIAQQAVSSFAYGQEGRPGLSVEVRIDAQRNMEIVVAQTGYADDSIEGERFHYVLQPGTDGQWTLVDMSVQYRCWRGGGNGWQDNLCP